MITQVNMSQMVAMILLCVGGLADDSFKEYEECINTRVKLLQKNGGRPIPQALLAQEGEKVVMKCNMCYRPDVDMSEMEVTWYRVRPELHETQAVPIGTLTYKLEYDRSLVISNIGQIHGALYICVYRGLVETTYYLEVINQDNKKLVVIQGKGTRPAKDITIHENNIRVYTSWSEWSKCTACDKVGLRRRTGICTVQKLIPGQRSQPIDVRALNVFLEGLPCKSSSIIALSEHLKSIRRRKSEILVDYCYSPCPTRPPVRNITDKYGFLIERVSGEGEYSIHEERPSLPQLVHRETHYIKPTQPLNLTCPKSLLNPKYALERVRWENGTRVLYPMHLRRITRGRVYIDSHNRLFFKAVWPRDSAYYSCWQDGWLVAVFHVECKHSDIVNDQIPQVVFFVGITLAIFTVFCIACQMWRSSKDKRNV